MINLTFKDISSSTYGLFLKSVDRNLLPVLAQRNLSIPGMQGVIDFYDNTYTARLIKVKFTVIETTIPALRVTARNIAEWLNTDEWETLIFSDESDKFYLARVYDAVGLTNKISLGEFDVTFYCQPFAYSTVNTGESPEWDNADFPWITNLTWEMSMPYKFTAVSTLTDTFENPGTYKIDMHSPQGSLSQIVIVGTWTTISIEINGKTLTFSEAAAISTTLVIDNVEMTAMIGAVSKLQYLTGDIETFLEILPGTNDIEITGTAFDVEVSTIFTPMWL